MTRKSLLSGITSQAKIEYMEKLYEEEYQIDTSDQDAPVDRDEDTSDASNIGTKERKNTRTMPRREN